MKTNQVFPWEGRLVWVGTPRTGTGRNDKVWKSVDFTLEYDAEDDKTKNITFNVFGTEKVDMLEDTPIGSTVRVSWWPSSHEYNGKWYTKLEAFDIERIGSGKESEPAPAPAPVDDDCPF